MNGNLFYYIIFFYIFLVLYFPLCIFYIIISEWRLPRSLIAQFYFIFRTKSCYHISVKDIVPTGLLYKVPPIYYSVVHRRSILHYIYVASGRDSVILNSYSRLRVDFFFYRDVPKTEISHHTRSKDAFLDVLVPRGTRDVDPGGGGRRSVLKKKSIFSNSSCISWKNSSLPRGFWDLNLEYQAG